MALTRLDNLISSKTGKYLYVSPDDFNASDELNNRGNSPIRPFKSIQRAFIEISRYSYQPGPDNDRFDQFTVMVMPGKHYIDNRPGLVSTDGIDAFSFDQALGEWVDSSNLDISDPNNKLYLFNNTEGGAIIPRGSSIIGYDLRRTSVHPLFVPDPADMLERRSAIFNVTGGCYFWQFTIRDGDLEPASPLYDQADGVGKVYYQNGKWNELAVPNFSHHKLTVFEYADKEELTLYYQKIAKAFAQYQPTIDDANEFGDRIEETRIVGPLSDIRAIESIKCTDSSPAQTITVEVTTKVNHGYFKNQFIAIESNGLDDAINGTFAISSLDLVDKRKFTYKIPGTVSALGTITNLVSGTTYTNANGLDPNCVVKAEVDSVESASPYVFNCSIRSTWGICGIWANGLKATGFKSMVIAQYTGVSLQKDDRAFIRYDEFTNTFNQASLTDAFATVPYHTKGDAFWKDDWRNFHVRASEDAFIQCVSIFAVGYADHFLMESGGDMSITNSNSNFGNTSLHAIGHKGYSFNQDKGGYITDIVPPQQVEDTAGNTARQSYYTLDVYASNDAGNHTKIYHGDDSAYDPSKRPAATIGGYRIGAKTDDKLKVKLNPATAGGNNKFFATLEPSGFKKFTAAADILNPSGVTINNKTLDAADRIEANKEFIMHEAYDRVLAKYPALKVKESITITKCRRDVGYLLDATIQDLRLGGNVNTIQAAESYYVGNNLSYITGELTETLEGYNYAKDLAIAAMRNFTYLRTGVGTSGGSAIVNIGDTSGVVEGMTVADYDPAMFTDGKLNAGATRPGSPTIPNNTFVKKIIDSTSIELGDNTQTAQKKVFTDRHGNARELILANKTFIATEAYERMLLDYPGYTPSTGYTAATGKAKCIDDLEKAIAAIAENVGYGGNAETWDASDYYTTGAVTDLAAKKDETLTAFNYCKDMAVQVMRKENVFVYGAHGLTQSTSTANDPITDDPSPELVSNRNGDARNLIISNKNLIAAEAVERMVSTSSTQKFTPSGATYDPTTGDFVITSAAHGLTAATSITATGASYTPADGKLIITSNGHGFTNGQKILIKDGSLNFECAMDAGATIHSYPRPSDPFSGKWLTISNKTTNTFEVNVGASSQVTYTPTTGTTYNPSTGLMVLNIGNHSLRGSSLHTPTAAGYNPTTGVVTLTVSNHGFSKGDKVKLNDNSLTFTCAQDSHATNHTYPRSSDPISGKWQEITNVTKDTFDITVLTTTPSTNVTAHIFVGASNNALIRAGESIRLAANSLKFSCGFGGATGIAAEKTYPRASDPFYNKPLPIESATVDTITVQVLTTIPSTNTDAHTFVSATAGAVETGGSYAHNFTSAVANGILAESDSIRIDYEALKFTCAMDGHATYHSYPKVSDPAAGKILPVTSKTTDTFTVNVGKSLDKKHDVTGATYNTSTGDLTLTLNKHNLIKGNTIRISDNSLSFKCSKDGNVTTHTYPRNDTSQHTITAAAYNPTTGIVTATIAAHGFENGDMIILADNSLTFTCLEDSNATNKTYPRATDPVSGKYIPVSNVTTNTFEIQILDVTPSTNVTAHTFVSATANGVTRRKDKAYQNSLPITKVGSSFHTATDATYTPKDGILELTVAGHGMSSGDRVKISRDSLVFKCAMDNYGSEHKYPRATDPSDGNWLAISNVTTDTFKVNVGVAAADQKFTPTAGTYDASSGDLVLTIGTHTLAKGESVTIDNESLSFTCTMDSNAEAQSYPRAGKDKASSRSLPITAVTGTTITINVGAAGTNKTFKPTASTYNADTGEMSLTIGQHGIAVGSDITLKDNSLTFTCSKDSNASQHTYPRPGTDPYAGKSLTVEKVGSSSHTATGATYDPTTGDMVVTVANHDFEKPTTHSPTLAVYNPTTGIVTLTITNHGLDNGDFVKIADGGLKFTCVMDGNSSIKAYPRSTDPASGANLEVSNVTANTFDVQILAFTPSTNTTTHTFSSADANCISNGGDYIQVADDSLTFTCTLDGNTVNKAYPRKGYDDASGKWFQITAVAGDTFTINVGAAGDNTAGVHTFVSPAAANGIKKQDGTLTVNVGSAAAEVKTPTSASYNPTTGVMTLTAAGHGLANGGKVRIAKESLKFTCAEDGNSATKLYPRATDPVYDKAITISNVTTDTFDVQVLATTPSTNVTSHVFTGLNDKLTATGAAYNAKTGIMTLTVASHGLIAGERIKLADNSISMTCAMDGNYVTKTYPRTTDPQRDKWIPVSNITTNTFDVQVGKAPLKSHTPTAAAYNPTSGIMEMTIGTHGYVIGDNVKIKKESLIFTCDQDSNATEHAYPRATTTSHTPSTAAYNPTTGVMTLTVNGHGFENNDWVKLADGAVTFNCAEDSNATDHAYPRASDPISKKFVQISNVTTNTFDVQVLASAPSTNTTAHVFVSAVANSITKKTDPYYDSAYQVTGVSATTISVQVLATPPSSNTTAHTFVTALPNAITAGGDYAHTFVSATASGITRASVIVGDQYTHTFVEASLAAVEYSPNSAHTWVSGKADCVKHYPDQIHKFVRGIANGVQRQNGTVTVNVGASGPGDQYAHTFVSALSGAVTSGASGMGVLNISAASYAPTTGVMELTLGADHGLVVGTQVKIAQDSLTFRCAMDTNASTHTYPRSTDPVYNKYIPITAVSGTTISINVGTSPLVNHNVTGASYTGSSGALELTIGSHSLTTGQSIKLADNSLTFSCNAAVGAHTFKSGVTNAITDNASATYTAATGTTYDPTTGNLVLEIGSHSLTTSNTLTVANGGVKFTCAADNHASEHDYPRATDPASTSTTALNNGVLAISAVTATTVTVNVGIASATTNNQGTYPRASGANTSGGADYAYNTALPITATTGTTITININGGQGAISNLDAHTFVSATAGAVVSGGNYAHTFVSATAGALITGGVNSHKFISAKTNSVHKVFSIGGSNAYHNQDCIDDVVDLLEAIADNVAYGGNDKTWDAAYSYKTGNHVAGASKTVTAATYTPADGNLQLTIGAHTNKIGERVRIPQGALRFTCAKDSNATNHDYPRATDPIATFDPTITAVTGTTITVNVGPANDNTAGVHLFVSAAKQIQVGGEEKETNIAFNHAKAMASQVIKNQKVLSTGSHGLSQVFDTTITTDTTQNAAPAGANGDAYNLLISNADLISNEAYNRMILNHSDFLPPTGNKQDCIDDIKDFVVEVAHNVGFGGNDRVWDMAQLYVTGAHVAGEETQTLEAFQDATQLAIQAMRNEKILITGSHGKTQTFDTTITSAVETPLNNKAADAFILLTLNKNFIADVAMARMIFNNGSYVPPTGYTQNDCKDDLKDIVDVLAHNVKFGGNDRIWDTANLYVGGVVAAGAVSETVEAVNHLRDIAIQCVQNDTVTGTSGQTSYTQVTYPATGSGTGVDSANPKCANETAAITSLSLILTNAISTHSTLASVTRTASTYKCTTIESTINTLSTIVQNAISTPASLSGSKASVSTATYAQASGLLELTVGSHSYKVGESVNIPNESLIFTCAKDSDGTQHAYPRSTDPMGKASSNITAVSATTITVDIGAAASADQYAHTFVRSTDDITVGGVKRTDSVGRCQNVRSTLESLFKIVTDTITTPSSLNSVTRNISNGKCQNVASTISTLFGILTNAITTPSSLNLVDRTTSPTGLSTGNAVNATATTTNSYLYFTLTAGRYTSTYTPNTDDAITQDTGYPQCNTVSDAVRQYFANITTIIQTGLNTVSRVQPGATSDLSSRSTIFTLKDWTPGGTSGSNPHQLETGTAVRLVPRPRYNTTTNQYVTVDKRNVRLPNGFDTNTKYYVIAPGRTTQPENYAGTTTFNGSDQTKLMLASSRENAAAGIYIHSAEVEAIDADIEIDIYQFVLDDKYDLHQYKCVLATAPSGGIQTEVPHIFDIQNANVIAQKVFLRKNEGGSLPTVSTSQSSDPTVADQSTAKILDNKFFYARYQNAKVFTIHKTHADAISNTNPIVFQSGSYDFSVFADKRESPMRYNPAHPNSGTTPIIYGKWYMQVKNESESGTANYDAQSILSRFHDAAYSDASGNNKTNDSWFERLKDERDADERIFRLRYVIPKYLKSVRDPLNGFTIKMRKDETRKLLPQRLMLKPVSGSITQAKFYNTADSGQATEIIGYTDTEFANTSLNLDKSKQYDPYKKDTSGNKQYAKNIRTANTYVDMTIESAKFITSGSNIFTEITVVNPRVENVALKNEIFTTVKVTAPQGGTFVVNATQNVAANAIEWTGNSTGSGYLHAAINIPSTTTWHLILKGVSGDLKFSATDNVRFTQGAVFADLMDYPDYGKSLVLKDLISEKLPQYYYRQNGAKIYTVTPGDIITDDANVQFYVESVEDTGELNDTFYIFNVKEIQKRIFDQQDGIFYLTALRGNHSPYPTGAGNQNNFRDFKFSQPVSKLYPLNYKNDPLWFKQVDPNAVDPPATYSAADNYVHGLVTVNDFKGSSTKESVIDMLATEALKNNTYTDVAGPADNRVRAQTGNASAGSEDRLIPISGDAITVSQKKLYVELRRPSIARAGNHTFEYLGFGPGNYSTGFPARQEVLLSSIQDFYAQSKKQNGGLVFYTGLNSNGDLYIGNRKIDAITGEEEFLESATLVDSADEDDAIGNLVTTFDTPVTFNEYITVNGGENSDKTSTFNSPVTINVPATVRDTTLGLPAVGVLTSLKVISNLSNTKDDVTLDTTNMQKNTATRGNILIAGNKVSAGIFEWNQRGSEGGGQGYKILTHSAGTGNLASNITPDQGATYDAIQIVSYGAAGGPKSGDMLLKGAYVGSSGSLGWILSNDYKAATGNVKSLTFSGSTTVTLTWKSGITNANAVAGGVEAGMEIRIVSYSDPKLNGTWIVNTGLTNSGDTLTFTINDIIAFGTTQWSTQSASAALEVASSSWKEWGVLGSQTIRTDTQTIGEYKLGVNTVARAAHADYETGFVSTATDPLANLDVVGTAWISGKTIENFAAHTTLAARTLTAQDHAFMVGGDSATPANAATLRVSTTNSGRVGVNTTLAEMQSAFTTKGTSEFTDNAVFQKDVAINGGGAGSSNAADVTTTITDGTVNLFMTPGFVGLTTGTFPANGLKIGGSARNIEIGNVATSSQNIKIGNTSADSIITIGDSVDGSNANKSKMTLGGAFASTESDSFVQIDTKAFKVSGDTIIGTRRGLTDTTKFESPSGTVEFLSGNSATSIVDFATNASTLRIAGQGGTTTIRNNLIVDATATFNADISLCGGNASYSFVGTRAQAGTNLQSHTSGVLGNNLFNNNVDLIAVLVSTAGTGELNKIDTAGTGDWGGTAFQATPAGQNAATFPVLTGNKYYLPIKRTPYDANGSQYYNENDILLIDTVEQGTEYAEFVKITRLPQINSTPYYIEVERMPFGTLSTVSTEHPDETNIYKCNVQYDATWTTSGIDATGTEDNVYLSQFGGVLIGADSRSTGQPGDYVILSRTTSGDDGEIFELKTTLSQVAKTLSVKNGCGTSSVTTLFEVNSVTGDVTINGDQTYTGALTLNGTCSTPYTNATTNKKLTITNGSGTKTFEVDTCTGDTDIGNTHGTFFAVAESYGSSPAAYTTTDDVIVYKHDPQSSNQTLASRPFSLLVSNIVAATSNIQIQANYDAFSIGDLCAIYNNSSIEIIQITAAPYLTGSDHFIPTSSNASYPSGGRGMEGTTATSFTAGDSIVKLNKLGTTNLMKDLPGTRALRAPASGTTFKARTPNTSDTRLELTVVNADLIQPKLDYIQFVRIGSEFFIVDSVDGSLDIKYQIKMPKSVRNPNTTGTPSVNLYGGGKTTVNDDFTINSGVFRMYGSDGTTLVAALANDGGHMGDGSLDDEVTGTNGLTVKGAGSFYGDLKVFWESCQGTGVCNSTASITMTAAEGNLSIGDQYYQLGKVLEVESATEKMLHIDNLGSAGVGGTVGPKDFTIYHNNAIDSFGIEKYWTANGGRRHTYVAFDTTTGIGQQEANPLQVNNNYLVNSTSGSNMVLYLPDNPQTGDMIRFVELSGNLTYNTSLIIRAKKINNIAVSIQGDATGSKLDAGSGQTRTTAWDSGEMVVQTRNSSFGLVYAGVYDIEGSTAQQTIPPSLRGWWLMEL